YFSQLARQRRTAGTKRLTKNQLEGFYNKESGQDLGSPLACPPHPLAQMLRVDPTVSRKEVDEICAVIDVPHPQVNDIMSRPISEYKLVKLPACRSSPTPGKAVVPVARSPLRTVIKCRPWPARLSLMV
ncbi:hypothetical protein BDK51DRAFT_29312, partial [Blyttiomyces helicus]